MPLYAFANRATDIRLRIETLPVFAPLLQPARYKGGYGGRGSGKSHFFAEQIVEDCVRVPGTRVVCIREVQKTLKLSSKQVIEDKIAKHGLGSYFDVQESVIRTPGDGLILFQGMQNHTADSIKSLEGFHVAWVEEAQSLSERSLDLLRPTIRQDPSPEWPEGSELRFSWNPENPTDPVDAFFRGAEKPPSSICVEAHYEHNKWFPDVLRKEMEYDRRRDPDKYSWIWRGQYLKRSEARVFHNWRIEEFETPPNAKFLFGADWGFSVDPSVLVRCFIIGTTLYVDQEAYSVGCEIDYLPALFAGENPKWRNPRKFKGIEGALKWTIVADSARPETISYMGRRGFHIKPAVKGKGSVEDGVEFLRSFDIVVHPRCRHTADELAAYSWKVDKKTDEILPVLADKENHVIDSLRYAVEGERRAGVSMADFL